MRYVKIYENYSKMSIKELEENYKYFHLSWDVFLSDGDNTFTFSPRVPSQPYNFETGTIEDDFTKRISLSTSIKKCLSALPEDDFGEWFIYGTNNVKNLLSVKEKFKSCPSGYGENFDLNKWVSAFPDIEWENGMGVSDLPEKYMMEFYGCVPDANKHDEFWSLSPLKMDYLGMIDHTDIFDIFQGNLENIFVK